MVSWQWAHRSIGAVFKGCVKGLLVAVKTPKNGGPLCSYIGDIHSERDGAGNDGAQVCDVASVVLGFKARTWWRS